MGLSWQDLTEMPLDQGDESSLAPVTQMAVELSKTPADALSRLMAKEFLRRKGGGEFFYEGVDKESTLQSIAKQQTIN